MARVSSRRQQVSLVLSIVLLPVALLLFARGFFPFKPVLPGLASHEDQGMSGEDDLRIFDRVIFMVVDALRSDFVYGHNSGFTYTQSLIRDGYALPYTAHASPPTVTMPRVKALTTGSVPSFLDLILNFAESDTSSSLASQDTWLAQLRAQGNHSRLVFYGDDTWLKLFPDEGFFARQDGTSSFFVSDFTEVDNNVTRHLPDELVRKKDWNAMVLHYLGLDHIGHKTGPDGPNMLEKQTEMDDIVEAIFKVFLTNSHHTRSLLVLVGDHGMNAAGNHGGSGPGETEPALLLLSPVLKFVTRHLDFQSPTMPKEGTEFHFYKKIQQIDIVPSLAFLLGTPIPKNSLGVVLEDLLRLYDHGTFPAFLSSNVLQMLQLVRSKYGSANFRGAVRVYHTRIRWLNHSCSDAGSDMDELACKYVLTELCIGAATKDWDPSCTEKHMDFLHSAQNILSSSASSYSLDSMSAGLITAALSLVLAALSLAPLSLDLSSIFMAITSVAYGIMMFASSYVEEEQHLWYWLTPLWLLLLATRRPTPGRTIPWTRALSCAAIIAIHRLCIRWNQTGQKHAGEPDIVHTFFPEHHQLMWFLVLATYILIGYRITTDSFGGVVKEEYATPIALVIVLVAIIFKLNFTDADAPELVQGLAARIREATQPAPLVLQARFVFFLLGLLLITVIALSIAARRRGIGRLQPLLTLFLATQTRAPNVPLFLLMDLQSRLLRILLHGGSQNSTSTESDAVSETTISALLLSYSSCFFFGGSNSISSLDLSNAYNGVADYNILAVGILLFASNWTGPIWWTVTSLATLAPTRPARGSSARFWIAEERQKLKDDAAAATNQSGQVPHSSILARWQSFVALMTLFHAAACLAVMAACTALRTHLFVWTVFSPKYLYMMAWSIGWHILINCLLGGALQALILAFA